MKHLFIAIAFLLAINTSAQEYTLTLQFEVPLEGIRAVSSNNAAYRPFLPYLKYGVDAYKIVYKTKYRGEVIPISGTICVPRSDGKPLPIMVFNHGTTFSENRIPSNWPNGTRIEILHATNGYITFFPDYIGYGESMSQVHPYMITESTVQAVVDMLDAGKKALKEKEIPFTDQLFINGFSQGGHASISLIQRLEKSTKHRVTAAVATGAPTRLNDNLRYILKQRTFPSVGYLGAVFASYNQAYWHRPFQDFFKEPYASSVDSYVKGKTGMREMVNSLSNNIEELMNPIFLKEYLGKKERRLKADFDYNSIKAWRGVTPLLIVHGTADNDVPYSTIKPTFEALQSKSKNGTLIELETIQGADHSTSGQLGMIKMFDFFDRFLKQ